jgi:CheY-like chemotaxis protein/DNA-directed RNA polymerase subunit RPC12/RpoP
VAELTARCPRCKDLITATPSAERVFVCPRCGTRLKAAATPTVSAQAPAAAAPGIPLPPTESGLLLAELRSLQRGQEESLRILRQVLGIVRWRLAPEGAALAEVGAEALAMSPHTPVPTRRPKTVLLIDDDNEARRAARAALEVAQVPVRAVADGKAAIAAIAAEKPDVIVLELALPEPMAGRDVINTIKATMEWVGIPIVLYTRLPIASQKEARAIHGADDLITKGASAVETLVARVTQILQIEARARED